jgi:hypothetical protein
MSHHSAQALLFYPFVGHQGGSGDEVGENSTFRMLDIFCAIPHQCIYIKLSEFILHNNSMRFNLLDGCLSYLMANAAPVRVSEIAFSYKLTHSAIIANC